MVGMQKSKKTEPITVTATPRKKTLCLNMIVKNESHIISENLEKLTQKVKFDYWVISDTGSTDNTKQLIKQFFKSKNIRGEMFEDEWKGFGHNRTKALEHAYGKTDYLLIFDADDEIIGDLNLPLDSLTLDSYRLVFGNANTFTYERPLIVNNHKKWQFVGVLHEYLDTLPSGSEQTTAVLIGDYSVVSGRTGNRSSDPDKYLKDAHVLEKAYAEELETDGKLADRYAFYCANSYFDCGQYAKAVEWYKTTLTRNGWDQEKYVCCIKLYKGYKRLGQLDTALFYLIKSFYYDKERVECIFKLIVHYTCEGQMQIAYSFYSLIRDYYENKYLTISYSSKLFVDNRVVNFFLPYYMIIVADGVKKPEIAIKMYEIIFTKKTEGITHWHIGNLLHNLQLFIDKVKDMNAVVPGYSTHFFKLCDDYLQFIRSSGYSFVKNDLMKRIASYNVPCLKYLLEDEGTERKKEIDEICMKSKNILFFTGFGGSEWNYTYGLTDALGGSERAVAYLTTFMPKDYNIYVAGDVKEEKFDNITYINMSHLAAFIKENHFHTVVISRYISFFEIFGFYKSYQTIIWAHDTNFHNYGSSLDCNAILINNFSRIDKIVCLTEWHRSHFHNIFPQLIDKILLINNGIIPSLFPNNRGHDTLIKKVKNQFVYSSCPERGLKRLLELWPEILKVVPDATLRISSYNKFPKNEEEVKMQAIINNYDNIYHMGKLNPSQLYILLASSEYWLYASYWPETSCITALEMLQSGVICLYYPVAGIVETIRGCGVQIKENQEIESLKEVLEWTEEEKERVIRNGKEYTDKCSWEDRARRWKNEILFPNQKEDSKKEESIIKNVDSNTEVVLVSAFLDIDRSKWEVLSRSVDMYVKSFLNYLKVDYKMVVFVDDRYIEQIITEYEKSPYKNKTFIPINKQWLINNIHAWSNLEKDIQITQSKAYNSLLRNRIDIKYPENIYPEYNLINHSKIDLICHAISNGFINLNAVVCWSDFGYHVSILRGTPELTPTREVDVSNFKVDKITISVGNEPTESDYDETYTLCVAPNVFAGSFFGGPVNKMYEFQSLYHECIDELYAKNISDDDQHVYLRCYIKNPDLFDVRVLRQHWGKLLVYFQKYECDYSKSTPLCEIMGRMKTGKGHKNIRGCIHNYTTIYHGIFKDRRMQPLRLFEMGLGAPQGCTPRAVLFGWKEFFTNAQIYGADINANLLFTQEMIHTFQCDHTNPQAIQKLWMIPELSESFDIIIEDSSREIDINIGFFENSVHKIAYDGYYIIENVLTSNLSVFSDRIALLTQKYPEYSFDILCVPSEVNKVNNNLVVIHKNKAKREAVMDCSNALFLVTSLVNMYCKTMYSEATRYKQTLNTIESIKKYAPNAKIVVAEASCGEKKYSFEDVTMFYPQSADILKNKSVGESIIIQEFLNSSLYTDIVTNERGIDIVFKMSGRYFLNKYFDITKYSTEKPSSRLVDTKNDPNDSHYNPLENTTEPDFCYITSLFSFPPSKKDFILDRMSRVAKTIMDCESTDDTNIEHLIFKDIEHLIFKDVEQCLVHNVDVSGVSGYQSGGKFTMY